MSYAFLFYQHLLFRHSCGKCPYTNTKRPSDITIADFWGVEKALPDFHPDNKGVSLMLVNTEKGRRLFDLIKDDLDFKAVDLELCLQPNLCRPSPMHPQRNNLERDYVRKGFKYVYRKYGNQSLYYKVRIFPYRVMNKLRSIAKKIFK